MSVGELRERLVAHSDVIGGSVTGHRRGAKAQNQGQEVLVRRDPRSRYARAGLGSLHPGDFPG